TPPHTLLCCVATPSTPSCQLAWVLFFLHRFLPPKNRSSEATFFNQLHPFDAHFVAAPTLELLNL
ncbi:MAG: hypothetical protein KAZ86_00850, partial [Comamonas sp.]|nr:hypothetical protein [Comamonas sp.]MCZ2107022.1 hypothetical protein [Burkholderiales bacterium]MBP6293083.1 hypothetical protein [Comamonas sp.]MBP7789760.1 hypothetical protein [Comamonas sp.]MBP7840525.1 hypothetical protein [Comamonas sp.]